MFPEIFRHSLFSEYDIYLFGKGLHYRIYNLLGCHFIEKDKMAGCYFAVWAPNAVQVTVMGEFNHWQTAQLPLFRRDDNSGIWEGFVSNVKPGDRYKYNITDQRQNHWPKADPYAFRSEIPPGTASIAWSPAGYRWKDNEWMEKRTKGSRFEVPLSIYEVHLGSWRKPVPEEGSFQTYLELAEELVAYVKEMGFTHVEFMPVAEYPYYPSWGYQLSGYYAASSRFGSPQELMYLIDCFHKEGIGVIVDWVPSHFPSDAYSLGYFDGSHLYEHPDPQQGYHPDWNSLIFNYGRPQVRSFLVSNALFWCEYYHIDGNRVDAVASMLFRDYSRKEGEWTQNQLGGSENLEAIAFIKEMNNAVHADYPAVLTIAEESTTFSYVTRPTSEDGLGFDFKWMMGWMNDTLKYYQTDPLFKAGSHHHITFSMTYAYSEKFILPFSHDEVVHGKGSMINKMSENEPERFALLRLLYLYMFTHPGAKLLFMGGEFAQSWEWSHITGLDWGFLEHPYHSTIRNFVIKLNKLYRENSALYINNYSQNGFCWIVVDDSKNSVLVYRRMGKNTDDDLIVILNMKPEKHPLYEIKLPDTDHYKPILYSNKISWGGTSKQMPKLKHSIAKEDALLPGRITFSLEPLDGIVLSRQKTSSHV